MSATDQFFESLLNIFSSAVPVTGRVIDQMGLPVSGASIRAVATGAWRGMELAKSNGNAKGEFELHVVSSSAYEIIVSANGMEYCIPGQDTGTREQLTIELLVPFRLTASVGDNAENRPVDLCRLQDRLLRLGRLNDDDINAEPVDLSEAPPLVPGPRLLSALGSLIEIWLGHSIPVIQIEHGSPLERLLAENPPFPDIAIDINPVGLLPGADPATPVNQPADFALVQDRLRQLGFLHPADHISEAVDLTVAGPVDTTSRPETLAAIASFESRITGSSLMAITPGSLNEQFLADPSGAGRRPLNLKNSIGVNGHNGINDVHALQTRLCILGYLSKTHYVNERFTEVTTDQASVGTADIPQTIEAIRRFRETRLGESSPAAGLIDSRDRALHYLNSPVPVQLDATVGWNPEMDNLPADVGKIQDRLHFIGLLSDAIYNTERVDTSATDPIQGSSVPQTSQALLHVSSLRKEILLKDAVGPAYRNYPADVRAIQDRLHGLGFLSTPDYEQERIDPESYEPVDEGTLTASFASIQACREKIFSLPSANASQPWSALAFVLPDDETHRFLNDPLFYSRERLRLHASVGVRGWNFPGDIYALQLRLRGLDLISGASFAAEKVNPQRKTRIMDDEIPLTCEAIYRLRTDVLGEAEPTIPRIDVKSETLSALEDCLYNQQIIDLQDSVGAAGNNHPDEVLAIQRRLYCYGFLTEADFESESRVTPLGADGLLLDSQLPRTIEAIRIWHQINMDQPSVQLVQPGSEGLRLLNKHIP